METTGRYRVVRKLGEGGMGVVYAAHDDRLDRPVAIKRIRPDLTHGQGRERFWREARAASRVSHPNICQLYEIDEDGEGLFLTMELLEGEPLSARLAQGPLPAREAVQVALSVLNALGALHLKGIVHRDLKPSNIFLSAHGVKLLDFGLARPLGGATAPDEGLTLPGVLLGTPSYLAPELIEGRAGDARSDLFAVGTVLYEMLAGRRPFHGDSMFDLARAIVEDEPPALGGSPGVVGLDRVVHRALRKSVDERYQTADMFAGDLLDSMVAFIEGRHDDVIRHTHRALESVLADSEVFYHWAGALAGAGDHDGALSLLERAVTGGFHPASALVQDTRFDSLRATADFRQIVKRAEELQQQALDTFRAADGPRLLGLPRT